MGRYQKKTEIIKNSVNAPDGIIVDGKTMTFNKHGQMFVDDPGMAAEIDARHGRNNGDGSLLTIPIDDWMTDPSGTQKYSHHLSGLPEGWHDDIDWGHA